MSSAGMERKEMSEEPETYDATEVDESKWGALRMIGLLALVAAFAGFVYLAYMQGVRNGAVGAPPVITADSGPYKVAPQNPGGQSFANQDKMIFDRVEGSSPDESKAASAVPPKNAASGDDMVSRKSAPLVVADNPAIPVKPAASAPPKVTQPAPPVAPAGDAHPDGIAAAIEKADTQPATSSASAEAAPKAAEPIAKVPAGQAEASKPAPTVAPPAETKVATAEPPPTVKAAPPAPATAGAAGAYVVQIASYKDMPSAQDAWNKFKGKFADAVGSHAPDYQTADVPGKGTYYRLRVAGFDGKDSANAFCQQLKSKSQGCIVVKG